MDVNSWNGVAEMSERANDGPLVMLNLLKFKPGGEQRYLEGYASVTMPMIEKLGAAAVRGTAGGTGARGRRAGVGRAAACGVSGPAGVHRHGERSGVPGGARASRGVGRTGATAGDGSGWSLTT